MKSYEKTDYSLSIHDTTAIRTEMKKLLSSIEQLEQRINVRDIVVEALYKNEGRRPEEMIEEIHTILNDTEEALRELYEVKESLSILGEELLDSRTVIL